MIDTLELKDEFNDIKNIRDSIVTLLESLNLKINTLKNIYKELLENNKSNSFGLDSLHFQNKVINLECEHKDLLFKIVDNRIYGDYYKLHQIIVNFVTSNVEDKQILLLCENSKNYTVYKDLDIKREYNFEETSEIHKDIILIIEGLRDDLLIRETNLKIEDKKRKSGLNIDNLINSYNFNNNKLKQQIELFVDYVKVFHKFHIKYLNRFNLKAKLFFGQINSDIKLENNKKINIDNIVIPDNINNNEKKLFDKDEQERLLSFTKTDTRILNSFRDSTKDILNDEIANLLNNSDDNYNDSESSNSNPSPIYKTTSKNLLKLYSD